MKIIFHLFVLMQILFTKKDKRDFLFVVRTIWNSLKDAHILHYKRFCSSINYQRLLNPTRILGIISIKMTSDVVISLKRLDSSRLCTNALFGDFSIRVVYAALLCKVLLCMSYIPSPQALLGIKHYSLHFTTPNS